VNTTSCVAASVVFFGLVTLAMPGSYLAHSHEAR
jgi:hypothetical protein